MFENELNPYLEMELLMYRSINLSLEYLQIFLMVIATLLIGLTLLMALLEFLERRRCRIARNVKQAYTPASIKPHCSLPTFPQYQ